MKLITAILNENEYKALMATSVKKAISTLQSNSSIGLILCDIMMPEQDGFDFLQYLKDNLRFSYIPVIMTTVLDDEASVIKSLKMGARDYIVKPIRVDILISKIQLVTETGRGVVLIVDDDELILSVIERIVSRENMKTLTAGSAEAAMKLLRSSRVDLVILDIVLPDINGLDFMVEIKDKYPNILIIIMTGHSGKYNKDDIIASGADGFIAKPFHNIDISRVLKAAF